MKSTLKAMMKTDKSLSPSGLLPLTKGRLKFWILFCFIFSIICHLKSNISLAQTFDSASYHIDFGNFNMTSGKKTSSNYQLTDTVGQNAPGKFTNSGFVVKAGFQYIYDSIQKFSFAISDIDLDFGSLTPNVGSTQTNTVTITTPSGKGYEILAIANHQLQTISSSTIPNTNCDTSCSISNSDVWTQSNKYGFGFNASGNGTSAYFTDSTYFRPFADSSQGDQPITFMSENSAVTDHSALITYKINISPYQSAGFYENFINLIAIPKY
jgi:hypothetical protein